MESPKITCRIGVVFWAQDVISAVTDMQHERGFRDVLSTYNAGVARSVSRVVVIPARARGCSRIL